jgi:hypothetical protein
MMTTPTKHVIANVSHPPFGQIVHNKATGTVNSIVGAGGTMLSLYNGINASGTLLYTAKFEKAFIDNVNISYTLGLYVVIQTPHTVTISVT